MAAVTTSCHAPTTNRALQTGLHNEDRACLGNVVHQDTLLQGSSTVDDGCAYHIHRDDDAQLGPDVRVHSHEPHQVYSNQLEQ